MLDSAHSLEVLQSGRGFVRVVQEGGVQVRAVCTVPRVVAIDPRQLGGERREQVEQRPGDDDVIVETHVQRDEDHREADT